MNSIVAKILSAMPFVFALQYYQATPLCIHEEYTAETYFEEGMINAENRFFQSAINDFSCALLLDPTFERAYLQRLETYMNVGLFTEALTELNDYAQYELPEFLEFATRCTILLYTHQYAQADENCVMALERESLSDASLYLRGVIHTQLHDYENALVYLTQAINMQPESRYSWSYYLERGYVYYLLNQDELAQADFVQANHLNPDLFEENTRQLERWRRSGNRRLALEFALRLIPYGFQFPPYRGRERL